MLFPAVPGLSDLRCSPPFQLTRSTQCCRGGDKYTWQEASRPDNTQCPPSEGMPPRKGLDVGKVAICYWETFPLTETYRSERFLIYASMAGILVLQLFRHLALITATFRQLTSRTATCPTCPLPAAVYSRSSDISSSSSEISCIPAAKRGSRQTGSP